MLEDHLLAIPVYNEARYLPGVLEEAKLSSREILVIDDGSTDRTAEILRRDGTVQVVTHAENEGYGSSIATAFEYARHKGYRWLITMDCDEQHEPSYVPRFVERAAQDDADIISGTRYPAGRLIEASVPQDRRRINRQVTELLNRRLGLDITDAFCGFKAYRVSALHHFRLTIPGYAMPMQFWVQAVQAGLRIRELTVRLIYNDPTRHFGGLLDDPEVRLHCYLKVFEAELAAVSWAGVRPGTWCAPCR